MFCGNIIIEKMNAAIENSTIPETVDVNLVNDLVIDIRKKI